MKGSSRRQAALSGVTAAPCEGPVGARRLLLGSSEQTLRGNLRLPAQVGATGLESFASLEFCSSVDPQRCSCSSSTEASHQPGRPPIASSHGIKALMAASPSPRANLVCASLQKVPRHVCPDTPAKSALQEAPGCLSDLLVSVPPAAGTVQVRGGCQVEINVNAEHY